MAGFVFVLIPTTGEFIAPLLVGGPSSYMFGNAIQSFFADTGDWNNGVVLAMWLVFVVIILMVVFGRYLSADLQRRKPSDRRRTGHAGVLGSYFFAAGDLLVRAARGARGVRVQRQHGADAAASSGFTTQVVPRCVHEHRPDRLGAAQPRSWPRSTASSRPPSGVLAAAGLASKRVFLRPVITTILLLPLVVPYIVLAVGLVILLHQLGHRSLR